MSSEGRSGGKGIVWLLCHLPPDDRIYRAISNLAGLMRLDEVELVVFGPEGEFPSNVDFVHVAVPFSLRQQGLELSEFIWSGGLPASTSAIHDLIVAEQLWCGTSGSDIETELTILRALSFWQRAYETMLPSLILSWGTTVPFSRLMLKVAQATQTPCYVLERGMFEDTLSLNLSGQGAMSNVGLRTSFIEPYREGIDDNKTWLNIVSYYTNLPEGRYSFERLNSSEAKAENRDGPAPPTILYLGAFDIGSGIAFNDLSTGDRHAGWVNSSAEGARLVANSLSKTHPGATLWIKSHPTTKIEIPISTSNVNIVVQDHVDYRDLIVGSDVCVTTVSSTQAFAILVDRPIVTLGNSFFLGRDIAYEARSTESLDEQLTLAVARERWAEKRGRAKQLVLELFRDELIGTSESVPTRLSIENLSKHLTHFAGYLPANALSSRERIAQFDVLWRVARHGKGAVSSAQLRIALGDERWEMLEAAIADEATKQFRKEMEDIRHQDWLHTVGVQQACDAKDAQNAARLLDADQLIRQLSVKVDDQSSQITELERLVSHIQNEVSHLTAELAVSQARVEGEVREKQLLAGEIQELNEFIAESRLSCSAQIDALQTEASIARENATLLAAWIQQHLDRQAAYLNLVPVARRVLGFETKRLESDIEHFEPAEYLLANPDVAREGCDPYEHWCRFGRSEHRPLRRNTS